MLEGQSGLLAYDVLTPSSVMGSDTNLNVVISLFGGSLLVERWYFLWNLLPYPETPSPVRRLSRTFLVLSQATSPAIGGSLYRDTSEHSRLSFQFRTYRPDKL